MLLSMQTRPSIAQLNAMDAVEFVCVVGPVFEHSPWVAEKTASRRPFDGHEGLLEALCDTVRKASPEEKMNLICAHPDLVGRMTLSTASAGEQAAAGLTNLSPDEIALFRRQNAAYRAKFGFPFIICARLNKKEAILAGFERRLNNSKDEEMAAALEEIYKIAALRLRDLMME